MGIQETGNAAASRIIICEACKYSADVYDTNRICERCQRAKQYFAARAAAPVEQPMCQLCGQDKDYTDPSGHRLHHADDGLLSHSSLTADAFHPFRTATELVEPAPRPQCKDCGAKGGYCDFEICVSGRCPDCCQMKCPHAQ